eukprot:3798354-Prymnesium_polylepis.1
MCIRDRARIFAGPHVRGRLPCAVCVPGLSNLVRWMPPSNKQQHVCNSIPEYSSSLSEGCRAVVPKCRAAL